MFHSQIINKQAKGGQCLLPANLEPAVTLLFKNVKTETYQSVILPPALYCCKTL